MKKILIENWRSYMAEVEREEKRITRLQEAIAAVDPKIVQILQKEVEETAYPTVYPRVNSIGGLIRAIVCPDPVEVKDMTFGTIFLDWK